MLNKENTIELKRESTSFNTPKNNMYLHTERFKTKTGFHVMLYRHNAAIGTD